MTIIRRLDLECARGPPPPPVSSTPQIIKKNIRGIARLRRQKQKPQKFRFQVSELYKKKYIYLKNALERPVHSVIRVSLVSYLTPSAIDVTSINFARFRHDFDYGLLDLKKKIHIKIHIGNLTCGAKIEINFDLFCSWK